MPRAGTRCDLEPMVGPARDGAFMERLSGPWGQSGHDRAPERKRGREAAPLSLPCPPPGVFFNAAWVRAGSERKRGPCQVKSPPARRRLLRQEESRAPRRGSDLLPPGPDRTGHGRE